MNKFIIVSGNPCDGFTFYGPYNDANEAGDVARDDMRLDNWWIAALQPPRQEAEPAPTLSSYERQCGADAAG